MPICFDVSEVEPMHCEIQEKFFHFILGAFFLPLLLTAFSPQARAFKTPKQFWIKR